MKTTLKLLLHLIIFAISYGILAFVLYIASVWNAPEVSNAVNGFSHFVSEYHFAIELFFTAIVFSLIEAFILLIRQLKNADLAVAAKLFYVNANNCEKAQGKSDAFLTKVSSSMVEDMWCQGATGWETFSNGPLAHGSYHCARSLKFVLMNPLASAVLIDRSRHCGMKPSRYYAEIYASILYCHALYQMKKTIELRLYNNYPLWKLIVLKPHFAWIQQYPVDRNVRDAISVAFEASEDLNCIYSTCYKLFEVEWQREGLLIYDFETGNIATGTQDDVWSCFIHSKDIQNEFKLLIMQMKNEYRYAMLKTDFFVKLIARAGIDIAEYSSRHESSPVVVPAQHPQLATQGAETKKKTTKGNNKKGKHKKGKR